MSDIDLKYYIPENMTRDLFITKLIDIYQANVFDKVDDLADELLLLRDSYRVHDSMVVPLLRDLGFLSDVDSFSTEDHRRLLQDILQYYRTLGTHKTDNFLAFATNSTFNFLRLYTADYVNFYPYTDPSEIPAGSYPTCRLLITYDIDKFSSDTDALKKLFYEVTPINWMIHNFVVYTTMFDLVPFEISESMVQLGNQGFDEEPTAGLQQLYYNGVATYNGTYVHNGIKQNFALDTLTINIV